MRDDKILYIQICSVPWDVAGEIPCTMTPTPEVSKVGGFCANVWKYERCSANEPPHDGVKDDCGLGIHLEIIMIIIPGYF